MKTKMENFEDGFADGAGSFLGTCHCGKTYRYLEYHGDTEEQESCKGAIVIDHSISWMTFEGKTYAMHCECWKERGRRIMGFIDGHAHKIAMYLKLEKERRFAEARAAAEVDEGTQE